MAYSLRTKSASKTETKTTTADVTAAKAKKAPTVKKAATKPTTAKTSKAVAAKKTTENKSKTSTEEKEKKTTSTATASVAKKAAGTAKAIEKATPAKAAPAKKTGTAAAKKVTPAKTAKATTTKKAAASTKAAATKKAATTTKAAATKKAATTTKAAATKKAAAPAKASATKKAAVTKAAPAKKAPTKKAAVTKKATSTVASKRQSVTVAAPVVIIEEVSTPSLPEIEPISHYEEETFGAADSFEAISNLAQVAQVTNTHIRFNDEEEDVQMKGAEEEIKDASITSSDFDALSDEFKDDPTPFELCNEDDNTKAEEGAAEKESSFEDEFDDFGVKIEKEEEKTTPLTNSHSAFDAFTSQESPKSFNWNSTGSTYYQKFEAKPSATEKEEKAPVSVNATTATSVTSEPTVISNPFGFGFTATNANNNASNTTTTATATNNTYSAASNSNTFSSYRPYPFATASSNFQSVSSPLDKLCNLTNQSSSSTNSANHFGFNSDSAVVNASNAATSSFLPTSPAAPFSKLSSRSSSDQDEEKEKEKEARSPSAIQSIIVDDKHEDFSAF